MRSWHFEVSPRRWFFLPLMVKIREFEGAALLASVAAERGWGVFIDNRAKKRLEELPLGISLERRVSPGMIGKLDKKLASGRRVAAICEEGLVYPSALEYGRRKIDPAAYERVTPFFAWGQNQYDDMTGPLGLDRSRIVVTGNPRLDVHRPAFRHALFDSDTAAIKRRYDPFVLINTRFSSYNNLYGATANTNKMVGRGIIRSEDEALEQIAFQQVIYSKFMEMIDILQVRFPELNIVIRPHPSELHNPWHKKAAEHSRVRAVAEGNVIAWIMASRAVIHTNCTTGVEAFLLDRPSIAYRPIRDDRFDMLLPNELSEEANDIDEICSLIAAGVYGAQLEEQRDKAKQASLAHYYMAALSGPLAAERIMDALECCDLPERKFSVRISPMRELRAANHRRVEWLRRWLRGGADQNPRIWGEHIGMKGGELRSSLRALQHATGRFGNINVERVSPDLYCLFSA